MTVDAGEKRQVVMPSGRGPFLPTKQPEDSFSVVAFVREMTAKSQVRGKQRTRGRPRKGMPKLLNEKKILSDMKKELGLREDTVKEFGFIEADLEEDFAEESTQDSSNGADDHHSQAVNRTRSGRPVRPPKRILKDLKLADGEQSMVEPKAEGEEEEEEHHTQQAVSFASPSPFLEYSRPAAVVGRRNFSRPEKYMCQVCGKIYLGSKKMARHLKYYPDHNFASPDPPPPPSSPPNNKKWALNIQTWLAETEAATILELVGTKLLPSFSLWDLLVRKVSYRCLGTVDILSSLFADIQALVMDLKNLAEQCLTSQRPNEDSFSVTLSPMMSAILGQSRNGGGVERFVLPYNQIPVHYHKLLGFPTGLRHPTTTTSSSSPTTTTAASTTTTTTACPGDFLSPDSTNSIFQPEEDNMSQMSLSSDILDRPLGDKVVLEENLGTRQQRTDMEEEEEETQDSSIADHHEDDRHHRDQDDDDDDSECRLASKRARLDSESRSSPPHFLHEEEESNVSNLSSTSNMGMKEDEHPHHRHRREEAEKSDSSSPGKAENSIDSLAEVVMNISSVTNGENTISKPTGSMTAGVAADSALARLPSFSSIINGSPKILASPVAVDENGGERDGGSENGTNCDQNGETMAVRQAQHNGSNLSPSVDALMINAQRRDGGRTLKVMIQQQNDEDQLHAMVGGSAPCSPHRLEYLRRQDSAETVDTTNSGSSGLVASFQRRGSLDVSTASILSRLCENGKAHQQDSCDQLFGSGSVLHAASSVNLAVASVAQTMTVETGQQQQRRFSFAQGEDESSMQRITHKAEEIAAATSMPTIVTSPFQNACDNAVFNVTSSSILYTGGGMSSSSFLDAAPKEHMGSGKAAFPHSGGLGHIYQDSSSSNAVRSKTSSSRGKVMPALPDISKRGALFSPVDSDHNHHHHHQEPSASPFLITSKNPSSPRRLPGGGIRLQEFNCSTHVTYSGELYHPIPSVSPVKDSIKDFDGGKRLRQTPPTSQSPSLFNDIESVLSEEFSFHSALSNSVENVPPAKTPEKLLASVPPSVIMNNKKSSAGTGFENYADFDKDSAPPDNTAVHHTGTLKNGASSSFDVSCHDNML